MRNIMKKINHALKGTYLKYENSELDITGTGVISDVDKAAIKFNMRKQDLFN
jgi:hypothetical protein